MHLQHKEVASTGGSVPSCASMGPKQSSISDGGENEYSTKDLIMLVSGSWISPSPSSICSTTNSSASVGLDAGSTSLRGASIIRIEGGRLSFAVCCGCTLYNRCCFNRRVKLGGMMDEGVRAVGWRGESVLFTL